MRVVWVVCLLFISCNTQDFGQKNLPAKEQVNIRLGESINRINPLLSGSGYAKQVEELIYLSLFQFDPISLALKPSLAQGEPKVEVLSKEQLKITFEIREEAKWSDGVSITADDYVFTFKMIFNPNLNTHGYRAYLSFIDKIEADPLNKRKILVWTKKKYHLAQTVLSNIEIFPEHIHDKEKKLSAFSIDDLRSTDKGNVELKNLAEAFSNYGGPGSNNIIGSGPYDLVEWIPQESIRLQRKKTYWAEGLTDKPMQLEAKTEFLNFKIVKDQTTAFQELKGKGIDIMNQAPLLAFNENINRQELQFFTPDQFTYYYLALNPQRFALSSSNGRKAVNKCFDIEKWIEEQMFGMATAITNPISPLLPYYDHSLPPISYDPSAAENYFQSIGFGEIDQDGIRFRIIKGKKERLSLKMSYSVANDVAANLGIFFKERAKKAGLEIIPKPMELQAMRKDYRQGAYDMIFLASSAPPADYDPQQSWHTKSWNAGNRVKFGSLKTDKIIDSICSSLDKQERFELYQEFQKEIYASQPFIFLYSPMQRVIASKGLKVVPANVWPGYVSQMLE